MGHSKSILFMQEIQKIEQLCQRGEFKFAIPLLQLLIKQNKTDPILYNFLGKVYLMDNQLEEAYRALQKTIKINPQFSEAYFNLGNVLTRMNIHTKAIKNYEKCIQQGVENEHIYNNLAAAFLVLKQFNLAEKNCIKALNLNNKFINAIKNMGTIYFMWHDSVIHDKKNIDSISGDLLENIYPEKLKKAKYYFQKYTEIAPQIDGDVFSFLGLIYSAEEKIKKATSYFNKAMQLKNRNAKDLMALSKLFHKNDLVNKSYKIEEEVLQIELSREPDNVSAILDCKLNMINNLNTMGNTDQARKIFLEEPRFSDEQFLASLRSLILILEFDKNSDWYQRLNQLEKKKNKLNLLSQSNIEYIFALLYKKTDKQKYLSHLKKSMDIRLQQIQEDHDLETENAESYESAIQSNTDRFERLKNLNYQAKKSSLTPIFVVGMPRSSTTLTELILSSHPEVYGMGEVNMMHSYADRLKRVIQKKDLQDSDIMDYLDAVHDLYHSRALDLIEHEKFVVDKLPANHRCIDMILTVFPNAKIINTDRDPIAVAWSCYSNLFGAPIEWTNSLDLIAEEYKTYLGLITMYKEFYKDKIIDANYNELTETPEVAIRMLLDFCGLPWNDKCLRPQDNKKAIRTISLHQGRKEIYKGSTEAWKEYEDFLQPLIAKFREYGII
jgi:tetratricopeptide (TPR) repeat protein